MCLKNLWPNSTKELKLFGFMLLAANEALSVADDRVQYAGIVFPKEDRLSRILYLYVGDRTVTSMEQVMYFNDKAYFRGEKHVITLF